jgi:putative FmdB family regulatory protein
LPLYEYQCAQCGRFEVIQKFSDDPLTVCPTCGREVHKMLSAPAIQFKGTGWYITDYARKGGGDGKKDAAKGKDAAPSAEAGKPASTSAESAPATGGGSKPSSS